ncbi:hypothetical protein ABZV60_23115 [Streptomyces sp. NPDC004787]|uniref:hypothetical protein n=1 Tax=Streptomyces sp. NPDC004787 TaxID=3154291 RepID=UPI0033AFA1A1
MPASRIRAGSVLIFPSSSSVAYFSRSVPLASAFMYAFDRSVHTELKTPRMAVFSAPFGSAGMGAAVVVAGVEVAVGFASVPAVWCSR